MKKKLAKAMALCAALACVATGCNSGGKAQDEIATLKVYMPASEQQDLALVMEEVNKIAEKEIGAKIDMIFMDGGAYTEKMNMKLATKDEFDICFTSNWLNPYEKGVSNECYYPLTELIDEYAPELWEAVPEYWFDAVKRDGEIYAVPNQQIGATTTAITMNKNWAEKYNLDVDSIKTIDDIEPFLQQIKENEPNYYPTRPYANWWVKNYEGISSCVGLDKREDGSFKAIYEWEAEGYQHGLEKLREWYTKGYFRSDIASVMDDTADFKGNKYVVTGTGWKPGFEVSQKGILGGDHIAIKLGNPYTGALTGTMLAVSAYSKHPDKAIKYISLMNTNKEVYNLICHGIEGKHYTKNAEGKVVINENGGYFPNSDWVFGNTFLADILEGQDDDIHEQTKKINEEAEKSPLLSFVFDSSKVQTEITQLSTVKAEYKNMLNNGSVDWKEHFEDYKNKMMKAGAENVLKEVQRQLDEYAKTLK